MQGSTVEQHYRASIRLLTIVHGSSMDVSGGIAAMSVSDPFRPRPSGR
jgi:hypothetical protein